MKRRENGEGTIYKRKDKLLEVKITIPEKFRHPGEPNRKAFYGHTKEEAKAKRDEFLAEREREIKSALEERSGKPKSFGELVDLWYKVMKFQDLSEGTRELYESLIGNHIKPGVGNLSLNNLDILVLQTFYNKLLESGNLREPGTGLKKASLKQVHNIARQALEWAYDQRWIASDFYRKLKVKPGVTEERKPMRLEDAVKFYRACEKHRLGHAFRLALLYGMRRGEILGLKWDMVSERDMVLKIQRSLSQGKKGLRLGPPKTRKSKRVLPIIEQVADIFAKAKKENETMREQKGQGYNKGDFVFFSIEGNPVDPRGFVRQFHKLLKQLNIPQIAFHDLRHSAASLLEYYGVVASMRMHILGHSDYRTCMDYSHVDTNKVKGELDKLGKVLSRMDESAVENGQSE